jgi:EAL domain-containing protein (putative c-di-GMP-specific phosphodiesterase class I)
MGSAEIRVAVNLSAQQLRQADLPDLVGRILARYSLGAGDLELEITESVLMAEPDKAVVQLEKLRDLGVRLSIDDFGTGYSSLSYLNILPIDALKLDRSFVSGIGGEGKGTAICAATLSLAASLGISTVAEGVEREFQAEFLREQGCDMLQGYLFAEPMPAAEAADFLLRAAGRTGIAAKT